jgi:hypothetical protein
MNKHDALIKTIERTIRCVPDYEDRQPGLDALISLADEYEKLREMLTEAEADNESFRKENGELRWVISRRLAMTSNEVHFFDSILEAYVALKAQQSGEEGE